MEAQYENGFEQLQNDKEEIINNLQDKHANLCNDHAIQLEELNIEIDSLSDTLQHTIHDENIVIDGLKEKYEINEKKINTCNYIK